MTSELRLRLASAAVLIAILALVLWAGSWTLTLFIALAGVVLISEYWGLVRRFTPLPVARFIWLACGFAYIAIACLALITLPPVTRLIVIASVIAVDTGAYFAGRAIGGPKIAPSISPSKTWAGLGGGVVGAWLVLCAALWLIMREQPVASLSPQSFLWALLFAIPVAVLAQAGDFLESWLKRRAGVKDSGAIIPGHGGLLDRVDGLMPVAILAGIIVWAGLA